MTDFYRIGGVGVMGYISPLHVKDTYAVIDPLYGIDGFRNVETIDDMIEIPEERSILSNNIKTKYRICR